MIKTIIKRDGREEPFDAEKLTNWTEWASVVGADWSGILRDAFSKLSDRCLSSELHDALIKSCLDREDEPHVKMAGRLYMGSVYKQCFGDIDNIPSLKSFYKEMVTLGYWEEMDYSDEELDWFDNILNHEEDMQLTYPQAKQIVGKYSVKNRVTGQLFETPQFTYMRMALGSCKRADENERLKDVPEFFYHFKTSVNCTTPDWTNLGTHNRGYASCCLFTADDSIGSLNAHDTIAYKMTAASAGLGDMILTRSAGDPIRGGLVKHNGKLPYLRLSQELARANKQGARSGALTTSISCLDPEIIDLISARNPKTVDGKRVDGIDYSFSVNDLFIEKVAKNEKWMLISYYDAKDLWDHFFDSDSRIFNELYQKYENDPSVKKHFVNARDVALLHIQNEQELGRQYETSITEINRHTPAKDKIHHSNLCQEILQPTKPYESVEDLYKYEDVGGEISLCSLSAIIPDKLNLEVVDGDFTEDSVQRYEKACYYALKKIDNTIDIMEYPFPNLEYTAKRRRNAGVGISGLAYEMARRGLKYTSDEGKRYMHMLAELHMYSLIKASIKLSKERGVAEWIDRTKWVDGWLPIDTYKKTVDEIVDPTLNRDWESLRKELIENGGHRFSFLCAHMPTESSSVASNRPNSLYPIRNLILIKGDGENAKVFIAPDSQELKNDYQLAWDITPKQMVDVYAIFQKFCDQGISADYWVHRTNYEKVTPRFSAKDMLEHWLYAKHRGVKTRYYTNTKNSGDRENTGKEVIEDKSTCTGGACTL